ncbi:MAG: TolC family protein [Pirellulales bacterium]
MIAPQLRWTLLLLAVAFAPAGRLPAEPPLPPRPDLQQMIRRAQRLPDTELPVMEDLGKPEPIPPAAAAAAPPLSLEELQAWAVGNNPALAVAAARVQAARGNWIQAGLPPNPVLSYQGNEIGAMDSAGMQGGSIGQTFITGGKLTYSQAAAAQQLRQVEQQLAAQQRRVENDVAVAYFDVLVAQRRIELAEQLLRVAEDAISATEELLRIGEVSETELNQARNESSLANIQLIKARSGYTAGWRRLAAVVGVPEIEPVRLLGDVDQGIPQLTWETSLARLMAQSPQLTAALAQVEEARWLVRRAQAEPVPDVSVQVAVMKNTATGDTVSSVTAGIPLPLFNWNQGGITEAQADLRGAQSDVDRTALRLQSELADAFLAYDVARQEVARYQEEILPNSNANLELAQEGYRRGLQGFLTLLVAWRNYAENHLAFLDALERLRRSAVVIEGLLLSGSLEDVNRPRMP